MMVRIRNAGQEREDEPVVSKKAFERVCEQKDKQYKEMRHTLEERIRNKVTEVSLHIHNESNYRRIIAEKERMTYYVGGISFFLGGAIGFILG